MCNKHINRYVEPKIVESLPMSGRDLGLLGLSERLLTVRGPGQLSALSWSPLPLSCQPGITSDIAKYLPRINFSLKHYISRVEGGGG